MQRMRFLSFLRDRTSIRIMVTIKILTYYIQDLHKTFYTPRSHSGCSPIGCRAVSTVAVSRVS